MSQNSCSLPKPPYMFSPNPPNKYVMSPCPSSVSASSQASSASSSPCLMNYSPKHSRISSISSRNTKNLLLNLQNDIKSEIRRDLGVETKGERDKSTQKVLPLTPLNSIHTPQLPPIQNAKGLMDSSLPIVHDSSLQFPDFNFNPPHDSYKYSTTVQSDNNRDLAFQQIPVDDKTASKDSIKTVLQSNNTNPANSGAETPPHIFLRQVPPTFTTSGLNISMLGSGLFSRSLKSTVAGQSTSFSDQKLFPEAYDQSPLLLNPINPFLDDAKLQSPIHFPKNSMSDSSPEVSQKEHSEIDRSAIISIVSDYKYDSPLTQRDQNSPQIPDNAAYLSSNSKQNASQSGEILAIDEKLAQIELPEPTISPSPLSKEGSPKKQITPQEKNSVNSNGRENLAEPSPKRTRSKQLPEKPLPPLPPLETVEQYLVSPSRQRLYQFAYKHEVPEELQETVAIDAYPNGPKNVLNSKLFLYSDPANADLDINDFDLVINVAKECPDLSKTFRSGPNREYLLVPWSHTSAISKELPAIVSRIDEYYRDDRKILVHCQCGVSRSACVIVAYFMYSFNIGVNQAYELLKSGTKTGSGDSIMEKIGKQGYTIDACERICPNMGLLFELMEFGDKKNGVMV